MHPHEELPWWRKLLYQDVDRVTALCFGDVTHGNHDSRVEWLQAEWKEMKQKRGGEGHTASSGHNGD